MVQGWCSEEWEEVWRRGLPDCRFTGWGGSENGSKIDVVFSSCFYEAFGSIWDTLWDTILVKNLEKCVAKTAFREVAKRVRKKR